MSDFSLVLMKLAPADATLVAVRVAGLTFSEPNVFSAYRSVWFISQTAGDAARACAD